MSNWNLTKFKFFIVFSTNTYLYAYLASTFCKRHECMVVPVPSLEKGGGFCGGFAAHPGKTNSATETTQQNTYQPRQDGDERGHDRSVMVSQMKGPGEIRKEARAWKSQLLTAKARTKIGTWNVRTLYSAGKLAQVLNEMKRYHVDIMGISEMRWTDCGKMESDGFTIYYSGETSMREVLE